MTVATETGGRDRGSLARANQSTDRSADPAHPVAARSSATTTSATPRKKKKKRRHIATWIAIVSAVSAVIAALIAYQQKNVANQQNIIAEQQQLLTLTTSIRQQLDLQQPYPNGLAAWSDSVYLNTQAAEVVISELRGNGVTGFEYLTVAGALDATAQDGALALAYYQDAINAPPRDVSTQADALRGEAAVYYALGQPDTAHKYYMQAVQIFSSRAQLTQYAKDTNIAQSYLKDAQYQLYIKECAIAGTDITAGKKFLSRADSENVTNASAGVKAILASDLSVYGRECPSAAASPSNGSPVPSRP